MPRLKDRRFLFILALVAVAVAGGALWWFRYRALPLQSLLRLVPPGETFLLHADVCALRQAGLLDALAGATGSEEQEYRTFVAQSGFEYRRDLDRVVAGFDGEHSYLVLQGRFDWQRLRAYAASHGGSCDGEFCRLPASRPGRYITFYPVRPSVLAMAVSPDNYAANRITEHRTGARSLPSSDKPLWLSLSPAALRAATMPSGTRLFASALAGANAVTMTLAPANPQRFELALEATCQTPEQAEALRSQLQGITQMLQKMLASERQKASPGDLTGILTAGQFRREASRVYAVWPIQKEFIDSLSRS